MQGRAGSGKTHLLGAVRDQIQRRGGYFFLVNMINGKTFWESVALALVEGMGRDPIGWGTQLTTFLRRLTAAARHPRRGPGRGRRPAPGDPRRPGHFHPGAARLRPGGRPGRAGHRAGAGAARLQGLRSPGRRLRAPDLGAGRSGGPRVLGTGRGRPLAQQIVQDISRLMALTLEPTVIAVDQLDTLFAQTSTSLFARHEGPGGGARLDDRADRGRAADAAGHHPPHADRGLLSARHLGAADPERPAPVADRFRAAVLPDRIPTPEIGRAIVAKRFAAAYRELGFTPPHPTWPVAPDAFADAPNLTPRALLRRVDRHVTACRDRDEITELTRLIEVDAPAVGAPTDAPPR